MVAYYDEKPATFVRIDKRSVRYNYGIEEITNEEGNTQYKCKEVKVYLPLTSAKITQTVIEAEYPVGHEQKLQNEYNAALLGVYTDEEAATKIENYKAFLIERKALKEAIDIDCISHLIK